MLQMLFGTVSYRKSRNLDEVNGWKSLPGASNIGIYWEDSFSFSKWIPGFESKCRGNREKEIGKITNLDYLHRDLVLENMS